MIASDRGWAILDRLMQLSLSPLAVLVPCLLALAGVGFLAMEVIGLSFIEFAGGLLAISVWSAHSMMRSAKRATPQAPRSVAGRAQQLHDIAAREDGQGALEYISILLGLLIGFGLPVLFVLLALGVVHV